MRFRYSNVVYIIISTCWVGLCPPLLSQHDHLEIGADSNQPGSPLRFLNPEDFAASEGHILHMIEPEDGIYHGDFHVGLTASVRAATLAFGGPEPDHPIPGTEVHLRIVDFQGPPGGILHFWESGQLAPTFSLEGSQASGLTWKVSGNGGLAGADPYGHIHGRRFSTSVQGRYQLTLTAYDHASNAPGNEPWHTESEPLRIVFQAGESGVIPPVEKTPVHYFEARQTHPLEVTPSGHHLLALNSGESRLSIFSLSGNREHLPVLIGEIPTGLTPVSVRARTDDEVWVVNEVSDSISVISLAHMAVIETISVPDEPADVVFSGDLAYVSCSQINAIRVIDCRDYFELQMIPLRGLAPRDLSVSGDGLSIFVSFLHSGNGTTILPADESRPQPTPWNPDLPPPPLTATIVADSHPDVPFRVIDHDLARIDAQSRTVTKYFSKLGTSLFASAISPDNNSIWIGATEAANAIAFEPNLKGQFIRNRLVHLSLLNNATTLISTDFPAQSQMGKPATSIAQPMSLTYHSRKNQIWTAGFASDRLGIFSASGEFLFSIDLRVDRDWRWTSRSMRGPRGLAMDHRRDQLYVFNKLSSSLSIVDLNTNQLISEIPVSYYESMSAEIRRGRGHLHDSRLSGNEASSCASCHIDGDRDGLAWDMGDPNGDMLTVMGANLSVHSTTPRPRVLHPMKGPMTTQTLWGLAGGEPFHWRGDKPSLESFNSTFVTLLAGSELDPESIGDLAQYLKSISLHPNPNRNPDDSLKSSVEGGNPESGLRLFNLHQNHCAVCHAGSRGSDNNLDLPLEVGSTQPVKTPHLRTVYQRRHFNPSPGGETLSGFGLGKDGTGHSLPIVHPYILHELFLPQQFLDVAAYVLSFDTGTPAVTGQSITLHAENRKIIQQSGILNSFTQWAQSGKCDLVAYGTLDDSIVRLIYDSQSGGFHDENESDQSLPVESLIQNVQMDDYLTLLCIPAGSARIHFFDRNQNNQHDVTESPQSIKIHKVNNRIILKTHGSGFNSYIGTSEKLNGPYLPVYRSWTDELSGEILLDLESDQQFFKIIYRSY